MQREQKESFGKRHKIRRNIRKTAMGPASPALCSLEEAVCIAPENCTRFWEDSS
jgi:hypothetical protein